MTVVRQNENPMIISTGSDPIVTVSDAVSNPPEKFFDVYDVSGGGGKRRRKSSASTKPVKKTHSRRKSSSKKAQPPKSAPTRKIQVAANYLRRLMV